MRAEGPKKLSAGTSRKSRLEGGVAASFSYNLITKYGHESGLTDISRLRAGIDDKILYFKEDYPNSHI